MLRELKNVMIFVNAMRRESRIARLTGCVNRADEG